jgi:hypothetical protein
MARILPPLFVVLAISAPPAEIAQQPTAGTGTIFMGSLLRAPSPPFADGQP